MLREVIEQRRARRALIFEKNAEVDLEVVEQLGIYGRGIGVAFQDDLPDTVRGREGTAITGNAALAVVQRVNNDAELDLLGPEQTERRGDAHLGNVFFPIIAGGRRPPRSYLLVSLDWWFCDAAPNPRAGTVIAFGIGPARGRIQFNGNGSLL